MLKEASLCLAIAGVFFLLFLFSSEPKEIKNINDTYLKDKVIISGIVDREKIAGKFKILSVNGTEVVCKCNQNYLNTEVRVVGLVEEYNGKRQIRVLRIS